MATLLAHIRVKTGSEAQFERVVCDLYGQSHVSEKGLLRYEYWRGQAPGTYYCLLAFRDYASFMAHQASAHHETAVPALLETIAEMRLEWLDPVSGAAPLPSTQAQELPASAPELMKQYANLYPTQIAAWWETLR
jgi:quinol monooxygenase YgiN